MKQLLGHILIVAFTVNCFGQTLVTPCKVGKDAPAFGFWTWPAHSTVKVYILNEDFEANELPYLLKPIQNWNTASAYTGSGVTFEYIGGTTLPLYCQNCLTLMRGRVFDRSKRHATELRTYSAQRDQIMSWAHIVIDRELTKRDAITNAVAHELGHTFGLVDCYSCKAKSTVMNQLKTIDEPNGMEGPTTCDIAQVRAAFKELSVWVRPAPLVQIVDEGEEPIDDDTPVVIRRP